MTIKIEETLVSVTYESDSSFPGKDYGEEVPVVVYIETGHDTQADMKRSMTVKIGDALLLPEDIDAIKRMIEQAEKIISNIFVNREPVII